MLEKDIIIIRHGDLDNPTGKTYNRDSFMGQDNIVHLSKFGQKQMQDLGRLIKEQGFKVVKIKISPEIRAQESAEALNQMLGVDNVEIDPELDDNYSPGPWMKGWTYQKLLQVIEESGNVYEGEMAEKYDHEQPQAVIKRMRHSFDSLANELTIGETGILISHGDPIAWLINTLLDKTPTPGTLTKGVYPKKGDGFMFVLDPNNRITSYRPLT